MGWMDGGFMDARSYSTFIQCSCVNYMYTLGATVLVYYLWTETDDSMFIYNPLVLQRKHTYKL